MLWLRNLAYWLLVVVITPPFFVVVMLSMLVPMGVNKTTTAWRSHCCGCWSMWWA